MGATAQRSIFDVNIDAAEPSPPATDGDYLGVSCSAKELRWEDRLSSAGAQTALAISQRAGLPEILGRVLAARGVTVETSEGFLSPTLKDLMPDPSILQDMDRAAQRIADAVLAKEKVAVFGDYDVDGACSSALMKLFLAHHGLDAIIYIPDRMAEGYGPNAPAISQLCDDGARLIVTVDCGTTSFEPIAAASGRADVVIIDHHQAEVELPDAVAVVNPNRQDDLSGQGHLCAAGVVFLVLVAAVRELRMRDAYSGGAAAPALMEWLDLVALATVCDVVPLEGLNRAFVTKGLQVMKARENIGLRHLADAAGLNTAPTPYHLGYLLGPRINAGGRIGNSSLGAELLSTRDASRAQDIAAQLDQLNRSRKAMEVQILEEAVAEADARIDADPDLPILSTGSREWHKGLVGLVASRLTERFQRPSCVISWVVDGQGREQGTGSLRSIGGVDIGAVVRAAVDAGLLIKGGGHAMAAGLTVDRDKYDDLLEFMVEQLRVGVVDARGLAALDLDGSLSARSANRELVTLLEQAGPYGAGHPQPRFAFPAHRIKFAKIVGEKHIRCVVEGGDGSRIDAIAFRAVDEPLGSLLLAAGGAPIHIAGHLRRDTWGGRDRIELQIEDAAPAM